MSINDFKNLIQYKLLTLNKEFKKIKCNNGPEHEFLLKNGFCSCPICGFSKNITDVLPIAAIVRMFPELTSDFNVFLEEYHKQKISYLAIYKTAFLFYRENIQNNEEAKEYAIKRGFYGVGYASEGGLYDYLKSVGFSKEEILMSGLCVKNKAGGVYDFFRNRIMFPIFDYDKNVVAFAGRIINQVDIAKYLNTKNSDYFKKGNLLYGLHFFRKDIKVKNLFICEGYADVHTMIRNGYPAVCTMGVALSDKQYEKAFSIAENVYLVYDGDRAGQEAIARTTEKFSNLKTITLPEGLDPDEFFKKYSKEDFEEVLNNV